MAGAGRAKCSDHDKSWNVCYELARQYFRENGNLLVPGEYEAGGMRLGAWIGTQRADYKKRVNPFFTQSRIDRLDAIGMVWDARESIWQHKYRALQKYADCFGNVLVPQSYITPEGEKLGIWLNRNRMDLKEGKLSKEKKELLEQLGMIWEPETLRRGMWDTNYELLKAHVKRTGGFPCTGYVSESGVKLGTWLNNQKANYKNGSLAAERAFKLEHLGIVWNIAENSWEKRYRQAREYYLKHGHLCPFSQRGSEMPDELANWLGM